MRASVPLDNDAIHENLKRLLPQAAIEETLPFFYHYRMTLGMANRYFIVLYHPEPQSIPSAEHLCAIHIDNGFTQPLAPVEPNVMSFNGANVE